MGPHLGAVGCEVLQGHIVVAAAVVIPAGVAGTVGKGNDVGNNLIAGAVTEGEVQRRVGRPLGKSDSRIKKRGKLGKKARRSLHEIPPGW